MIDWNDRWKEFLIEQGAVVGDDGVRHFAEADPHAQSRLAAADDILADLSHLGLIRADGPDAAAFLQDQLSNDIRRVDAGHGQLSAYCLPNGRMLALVRVFLRAGAYYLQLPATIQPATLARLKLFVLRAKVTLASADREFVRLGLSGPIAPRLLRAAGLTPPEHTDEAAEQDGITLLRLPGPHPRFEIIAGLEAGQRLWTTLAGQTAAVGASAWSWLDIAAGVPMLQPGAIGEFIPQMVNLDLLDGVSFQKGCYPGQEIVARVHHLGRVKQRLFLGHVAAGARPAVGVTIRAAGSDQGVGRVVDAQPAPAGGYDLAAVIDLDRIETALYLDGIPGPRLTLQKPPFSTGNF
ncbi:MAG: hypothetical protein A2150_01450 [Candidatus Muproteobacteria bacterium RBG_16_64_11]|uniref:GCVT N-terminal domain-containing protein n=1 Tax=Candidatus Muproteobacteria bacterium RBG_16_64_11 TaxID=1817758 RepID=A0A1F6T9N7_9PROT|nr:MAG: hypothetical protein A2150_01450 [Candidatus Muproteobacteria bacterium RBG_16_64_11]